MRFVVGIHYKYIADLSGFIRNLSIFYRNNGCCSNRIQVPYIIDMKVRSGLGSIIGESDLHL